MQLANHKNNLSEEYHFEISPDYCDPEEIVKLSEFLNHRDDFDDADRAVTSYC